MADVHFSLIFRVRFCLVFLALVLGGCAHLNVGHLQHRPWEAGATQKIQAKFFSFEFEAIPLTAKCGLKGTAHPSLDKLPPWADAVDDLSLTAYLSDAQGNILAQDKKYFLPQQFTPAGIPFEFFLDVKSKESQALQVSIGYRATFVTAKSLKQGGSSSSDPTKQHIFFASEDAVFSR